MMIGEERILAKNLIQEIFRISSKEINLMEFCGGHTVAILKQGIRQLLPGHVHLLSGPGCPVCVTATGDIDNIIQLSGYRDVITATFGDLIRVPGSKSSLQKSRAEGNDIRVVYSALEALDIARQNPGKRVVMVGIGFETTAPTVAASVLQAEREGIKNYLVHSLHKLTPPVMKALLDSGNVKLDGIICPGHVSTVIGARPYEFIPQNYGIACAITGFEPLDILEGIHMLVRQIESGTPTVEIAYRRAVRPEGNLKALDLMNKVFTVGSAWWRGIGEVPGSGLKLKEEYRAFDAATVFQLTPQDAAEPAGCLCGEILRAVKTPLDCPLFRKKCNPEQPVGPCMVSAEGACSAYYLYGESDG